MPSVPVFVLANQCRRRPPHRSLDRNRLAPENRKGFGLIIEFGFGNVAFSDLEMRGSLIRANFHFKKPPSGVKKQNPC